MRFTLIKFIAARPNNKSDIYVVTIYNKMRSRYIHTQIYIKWILDYSESFFFLWFFFCKIYEINKYKPKKFSTQYICEDNKIYNSNV